MIRGAGRSCVSVSNWHAALKKLAHLDFTQQRAVQEKQNASAQNGQFSFKIHIPNFVLWLLGQGELDMWLRFLLSGAESLRRGLTAAGSTLQLRGCRLPSDRGSTRFPGR